MKEFIGTVILIVGLVFGIIFTVKAVNNINTPNIEEIGPNTLIDVEAGYEILTVSDAQITATSSDYFEIENIITGELFRPEFIPPQDGETAVKFVYVDLPEGKYKVWRENVSVYSKTPTQVTIEEDTFSKVIFTIGTISLALFLYAIFLVVVCEAVLYF